MNNKGFTLVEILLVVTILCLIVGIAIPTFNNNDNIDDKEKLIKTIINSAESYVEFNRSKIEFEDGYNYGYVRVKTLVKNNLLKAPIIDPTTNDNIDLDNTWIKVIKQDDNSLKYEYIENCDYCSSYEITKNE